MLEKIISGGQTGADRAALDAALESGFAAGGYCPAGRLAEDGVIDTRYPLQEIEGGYQDRTLRNVQASGGTLLFYDSVLSGGTLQTLLFCVDEEKPFQLIDLSLVSAPLAVNAISGFLKQQDIRILNVAGPLQSGSGKVYPYVREVITRMLDI